MCEKMKKFNIDRRTEPVIGLAEQNSQSQLQSPRIAAELARLQSQGPFKKNRKGNRKPLDLDTFSNRGDHRSGCLKHSQSQKLAIAGNRSGPVPLSMLP